MVADVLLEVRGLTKQYPIAGRLPFSRSLGVVNAVDDVSFTLEPGKTLALVGESGCGKTTIAKMILRLETPTAGTVLVDGEDIHRLRGVRLRSFRMSVQAVFQDPWSSLSPRMRVHDIIAEPLVVNERLSQREVSRRVHEMLERVGLRSEQARNYPHEFSGGQRQRIAIASALISNPRIIVLDEPVSALDVSIRSQIINLFKDLQIQYGISYVLVAHDPGTISNMADHVAVMYLGKVVECSDSKSLFEEPKHPYTRALLSAALPRHPDDIRDEIVLAGEVPSPIDPPTGCRFHPRCPEKVGAICERTQPRLTRLGRTRHVACHLYPMVMTCH